MTDATHELNLPEEESAEDAASTSVIQRALPFSLEPFNPDKNREETRGDLARGLLWLLTFVVGGVLAFIGLGRLEGSVLSQSIFPSLVALAGTALGFYFGSQAQQGTRAQVVAVSSEPQTVNAIAPQGSGAPRVV